MSQNRLPARRAKNTSSSVPWPPPQLEQDYKLQQIYKALQGLLSKAPKSFVVKEFGLLFP